MKPFKISCWPNAKATSARQRTDIQINTFENLVELVTSVKPIPLKVDQKLITRRWQESRSRDNEVWAKPYIITLDFDSVTVEMHEIYERLVELKINHVLFTTWTHRTIETAQKKNDGKNCFKVMLELTAKDERELLNLTKGLGALVDKDDINKSDDISSGIFIGGCHPDFEHEFNSWVYTAGLSDADTRLLLLENCPKEKEKDTTYDDFEMWDKTVGQKWSAERIKKALSVIKYEEIADFSKMSIWYSIGYALHSTGDNDNFELWDEWCLENCAEDGVYNRDENEKFWAKQTIPDDKKQLCTLSTLWHLENLFNQKAATNSVKKSSWIYFDSLAESEPEEVQFLIKDLLVEKSIGFLVGTGGVGKSSMCLEIAKAISSGRPFFGDSRYTTNQGTVAIINKEDSLVKIHNQVHNVVELDIDRITRAQNTAYGDFGKELPKLEVTPAEKRLIQKRWENVVRPVWAQSNIRLTDSDGENLDAIGAIKGSLTTLKEELIKSNKPDLKLVIFDPMNMFHGGDQNSQKDMSYMFSAFQQIQRELDVTVLIVHHMNKSQGFSGSHTIRDSGRFMWYLQPMMDGKEPSDKFINFYVEKNNDAKANYNVMTYIRTDKGLLDVANIVNEKVEQGELDDKKE